MKLDAVFEANLRDIRDITLRPDLRSPPPGVAIATWNAADEANGIDWSTGRVHDAHAATARQIRLGDYPVLIRLA